MALPVSYTTVSKMLLTFNGIGSVTALNSDGLAHHAGMAESYINARLSRLYTIPFTSTPPLLETLATDMSIYNVLSSRISMRSEQGDHPWYLRFKDSLKILDDIASGKIALVDSSGSVITGTGNVGEVYSNNMNYAATTTELPESIQRVDPDKVDDLLNERDLGSLGDQLD